VQVALVEQERARELPGVILRYQQQARQVAVPVLTTATVHQAVQVAAVAVKVN
jgi:hypothetical protein